MTIRQISEAAGCSINTVRPIARSMFPNVKAKGRGLHIDYTESQSIQIMGKVPKRNFVINPSNSVGVNPSNSVGVDYKIIGEMISMAVSAAMKEILPALLNNNNHNKVLLPAPRKTDRSELNQLVRKYADLKLNGDYREAWNLLYREILYRLRKNIKVCSKNEGIKPIDYLDNNNMMQDAISIIIEMIGE